MIGLDSSQEMLEIALEKRDRSGLDILYLFQEMQEFELFGTVRAVVSVCDSINYLLDEEELLRTFRLVNNYLDPGGILIFDFNTEHKYRTLLADNTIAENRDEGSFIWDNYFDEESRINEYDLTLFIPEGGPGEGENPQSPGQRQGRLYRRYQETHYQRAFSMEEIFGALEKSGMERLACYDAFTKDAPRADSERVCVMPGKRESKGREPIWQIIFCGQRLQKGRSGPSRQPQRIRWKRPGRPIIPARLPRRLWGGF